MAGIGFDGAVLKRCVTLLGRPRGAVHRRIEELGASDVTTVTALCATAGFTHIDPNNVKRVASAKSLYNFDALKAQKY